MPSANQGEQFSLWFLGGGVEQTVATPEFATYNATSYGWELATLLVRFKKYRSPYRPSGAGTQTYTFTSRANLPVLAAGILVEITSDSDVKQGPITIAVTKTYWGGATQVATFEGQVVDLTTKEEESGLIVGHWFHEQVTNVNLTAGGSTLDQKYVPIPHVLADSVADAGFENDNPLTSVAVAVTIGATFTTSCEILGPGSGSFDALVEALLLERVADVAKIVTQS